VTAELQGPAPMEQITTEQITTELQGPATTEQVTAELQGPVPMEQITTEQITTELQGPATTVATERVTAKLQGPAPMEQITTELQGPALTEQIAERQGPAPMDQVTAELLSPAQPSTSGRVSFSILCPLPQRIKTETRARRKPPSYVLTSTEHFEYLADGQKAAVSSKKATKEKVQVTKKQKQQKPAKQSGIRKNVAVENGMRSNLDVKQKGKRKRSTTHLEQKCQSNSKRVKQTADQTRCSLCSWSYGQADDPKKDEVWIQCHTCGHWFHETCAEDYGILDDSVFTCYSCC